MAVLAMNILKVLPILRQKNRVRDEEGENGNFKIELELFADVGLIGLPNAGKSSLTKFS